MKITICTLQYTGLLFLKADLQQKQVKFLQLSSNNIWSDLISILEKRTTVRRLVHIFINYKSHLIALH